MVNRHDWANLDLDRASRTGDPEVVYAAGKTPTQVVTLLRDLAAAHPERAVLATRLAELPGIVAEIARDELADVMALTKRINVLEARIRKLARDRVPALMELLGCAALNLWVAAHFDTETWVNIKTFGYPLLNIVFVVALIGWLWRYVHGLEETADEKAKD